MKIDIIINAMKPIEPIVKDYLNISLGVPVKLIIKFVLFVLVLFLLVRSCKTAFHQYSPVVQRVSIDDINWNSADWINIYAVLDTSWERTHEDIAKGHQYIDFTAHAIEHGVKNYVSLPSEAAAMCQDTMGLYTSISLSASGNDFTALYDHIDEWCDDAFGYAGPTRVSKMENGHKYLVENYSKGGAGEASIAVFGDNIFTDTDPKNPYIAFTLTINEEHSLVKAEKNEGTFCFTYNNDLGSDPTKPYPTPIRLVSVYPEPDVITPTKIEFNDNFNQILEHGLYIIAEDLSKKKENDVSSFLNSVCMGLFLSWLVQLVIGLIKDLSFWLNKRGRKI